MAKESAMKTVRETGSTLDINTLLPAIDNLLSSNTEKMTLPNVNIVDVENRLQELEQRVKFKNNQTKIIIITGVLLENIL